MMSKVEARMDLRNVQEKVEDRAKMVRTYGRKAERVYLGLLGMAYDYSRDMMKSGMKFLDKAEERGVEVEKLLNEQMTEMRKRVESRVEEVKEEVTTRGEAMEKEVQKALDKVKPSSINGKRAEVDQIKIDVEVDMAAAQPIAGYDEMNVEEVRERLGLLDVAKLQEVRAYEAAHKNRVTVLREIDDELEARAQAAESAESTESAG